MTETEKSLFRCTEWCKVATLPDPWDKKSVFITGICRTRKNDGCYYYAYCEKDKQGKNKIIRDFGPARAIVGIVEYYPLLYLESSYVRKFKKDEDGTANLIEYLKKEGVVMDFENADRKALDKANIAIAIQRQLADAKKKSKLIIKD